MRLATKDDMPLVAGHVLQSYLGLFNHKPREYYHQVCGLSSSFPHLFDKKKFEESIHVVVYNTGYLIATAGAVPIADGSWKLVSIYVAEYYRNHGLATKMINMLLDILRSKNVPKVTLFTLPNDMPNAINLYKKLGFKLSTRIEPKEYSDGTPRDMVYETYEMPL